MSGAAGHTCSADNVITITRYHVHVTLMRYSRSWSKGQGHRQHFRKNALFRQRLTGWQSTVEDRLDMHLFSQLESAFCVGVAVLSLVIISSAVECIKERKTRLCVSNGRQTVLAQSLPFKHRKLAEDLQ